MPRMACRDLLTNIPYQPRAITAASASAFSAAFRRISFSSSSTRLSLVSFERRSAVDVDQVVRRATGEADVRLLGLARAVDHAADHGNVERHQQVLDAALPARSWS